jgi:KDO2-lipid IV(A) lauroyltransferase
MWLLHFLPLPLLAKMGNALGMLLYWFAAERSVLSRRPTCGCASRTVEAERKVLK